MRCVGLPQESALALFFLAVLSTQAFSEEGTVPLEISYPLAPFPERRLEDAIKGLRMDPTVPIKPIQPAPPMVPKGTALLSKGKPVSSSDKEPVIGELPYVTNGIKNASDGSYVEIGPGCQYVQIDLERSCRVYVVAVWHFFLEWRGYHDVVVQISEDETFREGVTTIFNNDDDGSCGLGWGDDFEYLDWRFGKLIEVEGIQGRHVRLYSNGSTVGSRNQYVEVEVYGLATE